MSRGPGIGPKISAPMTRLYFRTYSFRTRPPRSTYPIIRPAFMRRARDGSRRGKGSCRCARCCALSILPYPSVSKCSRAATKRPTPMRANAPKSFSNEPNGFCTMPTPGRRAHPPGSSRTNKRRGASAAHEPRKKRGANWRPKCSKGSDWTRDVTAYCSAKT